MSENNQLLKEILKEVREIKAHIIPSSVSSNEDLTYIPELLLSIVDPAQINK